MNEWWIAMFSSGTPGSASAGPLVKFGPGKLFNVGSWPSKGFSLSVPEADAAIGRGGRIPVELEHARSILDGKMGYAELTGRVAGDLHGNLFLPLPLVELIGAREPLKVSMVWDTVTKKPLRVGLVLNPAITGAQVEAAFSLQGANALDPRKIYAARVIS